MNLQLTDITFVIDRSGSMESMRSDAEGGINSFIGQQKALPGEAVLTLVQFDSEYEFIHKGTPLALVGPYQLVPRGSTALLDAMGRAMQETGERLAKMAEVDRPGLVVFVVMTDGQENASQIFTKAKIKKMVRHQQKTYNWKFTFLGANQDALLEAQELGVETEGAADFCAMHSGEVFQALNQKVHRMRQQRATGKDAINYFTDEERESMK